MAYEFLLGLIGTITGVISLGILTYKTLTERVILDVNFLYNKVAKKDLKADSYDEEGIKNVFSGSIDIHNKGRRQTTINEIKINLFDNSGSNIKTSLVSFWSWEGREVLPLRLSGDSTRRVNINGRFNEEIMASKVELIIEHTHGIFSQKYNIPLRNESAVGIL